MDIKKRTIAITLCAAFILAFTGFVTLTYANADKLPDLHDGDLIFQTSSSSQSKAILIASGSLYSHMGIIKKTSSGIHVIEAVGPVKETPLQQWIDRGHLGRITIKRHPDIDEGKAKKILSSAKKYYGQSYDLLFMFNNGKLYCSELPFITFAEHGITLGKIEKFKDLNTDNGVVRELVEKRAHLHPLCKNLPEDKCFDKILDQELITPQSIAEDPSLTSVYSNYGPVN